MAIAGVEGLAYLEKHPDYIERLQKNIQIMRDHLHGLKGIRRLSHPHESVSPIVHLWLSDGEGDRLQKEKTLQAIVDEVYFHSYCLIGRSFEGVSDIL